MPSFNRRGRTTISAFKAGLKEHCQRGNIKVRVDSPLDNLAKKLQFVGKT